MEDMIKRLAEMALEESEGACHYAKRAAIHKEDYPNLAQALYDISGQEQNHAAMLAVEAKRLLEKLESEDEAAYGRERTIYEYLREKWVEHINAAKTYQAQYRGG